jgi:hypothetical protein
VGGCSLDEQGEENEAQKLHASHRDVTDGAPSGCRGRSYFLVADEVQVRLHV